MTSKALNKKKCCACHYKLPCHPVCRCVPKAICVTITGPDTDDCPCETASEEIAWDCETESYHGEIVCGGSSVDFEFTFERIDGEKYFCLESECLGLLGEYKLCEPFFCYGDDFNTPGDPCSGVSVDENGDPTLVRHGCKNPTFTFDVDPSDCGNENCTAFTISTEPADRITVRESQGCGGCVGCRCICRCLCLTYSDSECTETAQACYDEETGKWSASFDCSPEPVTAEISIAKNEYTGLCELLLSTSVGDGDDPADLDSCPDVFAEWTVTKEDETTATVTAVCRKCGECDGTIETPTCPCDVIPTHINFTSSKYSGATEACWGSGVVTFEPGNLVPTWLYNSGTFCIRLECIQKSGDAEPCTNGNGAFGWQVTVGSVTNGECNPGTIANPLNLDGIDGLTGSCSCDPLYINVKYLNTLCGGIGDGLIRLEFSE